jgi:hypothetical protein
MIKNRTLNSMIEFKFQYLKNYKKEFDIEIGETKFWIGYISSGSGRKLQKNYILFQALHLDFIDFNFTKSMNSSHC